jgi:hypothetical protein
MNHLDPRLLRLSGPTKRRLCTAKRKKRLGNKWTPDPGLLPGRSNAIQNPLAQHQDDAALCDSMAGRDQTVQLTWIRPAVISQILRCSACSPLLLCFEHGGGVMRATYSTDLRPQYFLIATGIWLRHRIVRRDSFY